MIHHGAARWSGLGRRDQVLRSGENGGKGPGRRNAARPPAAAAAVVIGVGVAAIISIVGPLTQAGINPARDFGPRLVAFFLGWGEIAIPGPRGGWLTVYIIAPILGALIGGGIYRLVTACMPGLGSGAAAPGAK